MTRIIFIAILLYIFANIYEIKSIEDLELFLQVGAEEILRLLLIIKSKLME